MTSKTSALPLLPQHGDKHNGSYLNGDYVDGDYYNGDYSKSKRDSSSMGGADSSMTKSTHHELARSFEEHHEDIPYDQLEQSQKKEFEDEDNNNHPSALYILFVFLLGCIVIFIGVIFYQNLFFDMNDDYIIDLSYFLISVAFGSSCIAYSVWNTFQIYFNCMKDLNITGFTIFFMVLGVFLLILSVTGFLDEYVDAYDGYDLISYPVYVIFGLFGVSMISLIISWVHYKYKEKHDRAQKLKDFYFHKMMNEEGDGMDYKLSENQDKLSSYIKNNGIMHPYDRSILSMIWHTLTHAWLFRIIHLGAKRTLQSYDMYLPPKGDDIEYNMNKWLLESERYKRENPDKPFSSWKV